MKIFDNPKPINEVNSPLFNSISVSSHDNGTHFLHINNVNFMLEYNDYSVKTTEDSIVLCKPRVMLDSYLDFFSHIPHDRIVELGIFQGGSSIFFASVLKKLKKIVCFDRLPDNPVIRNVLRQHHLEDRISLHFNTNQDSQDIVKIVNSELNAPPDIILDDCSHLYEPTKASFQMLFPLLRPGGLYIIEDWWWAHRPAFQGQEAMWHNERALSNLIFDLVTLQGTNPSWIAAITLYSYGGMVIIQKGTGNIPSLLDIQSETQMRGRKIGYI